MKCWTSLLPGRLGGLSFRWLVAGLVAATLMLFAFWALWPKDEDALRRIFSTGVMRVGLDPSFPPFESLDAQGNVIGYDVDLAWAIGERLGNVQPEFKVIGFDGLYDALWAGKVDLLISAMPVDMLLTEDVAYSQPYFNAGLRFLRRQSDSSMDGMDDLAGRSVGVEWGSEADVESRRLQHKLAKLSVATYMTAQESLGALLDGEVDAILVEGVSAMQYAASGQVEVFGGLLTDRPYAVSVRPKERGLLRFINQALGSLQEDGTLAQLEARWMTPP